MKKCVILCILTIFMQELYASNDNLISNDFFIPQGGYAIYDGVRLHLEKDAQINCGTINTQSINNPGTLLVNTVLDKNNKIVPHLVEGTLNVYNDGIFINNFDGLSNTTILSSTSNIYTDTSQEFNISDNTSISNGIILNGGAYDDNKKGNSILILEPGVTINITNNNNIYLSKGQIYGGIVDLTKYIAMNNNKITLSNNVTLNTGQLLNAHVKNAFVKLFNNDDINNIKTTIGIDNTIGSNNNAVLFSRMKFTNCITKIPGSSYYSNYGEYKQIINESIKTYQLKYNEINNLEIVKQLFSSHLNPVITSDSSLKTYNLMITNINDKKSFTDLFKKYINYNCYIQTNDSNEYKISDVISDEVIKDNKKYKVSNEFPLEQANINLMNEQSIYMQVKGNNIKIIRFISNEKDSTINIYNEWIQFSGIIITENISNIVQYYRRMNRERLGNSFPILSNKKLSYIFKGSGILDLNYINADDDNEVNFQLKQITVDEGTSKIKKSKVICSKHKKAKCLNIYLNNLVCNKNSVLKFDSGVQLIIGE